MLSPSALGERTRCRAGLGAGPCDGAQAPAAHPSELPVSVKSARLPAAGGHPTWDEQVRGHHEVHGDVEPDGWIKWRHCSRGLWGASSSLPEWPACLMSGLLG